MVFGFADFAVILYINDDGVRFWLDNELLFDKWQGASGRVFVVDRMLAGIHDLRVEYCEGGGFAGVHFDYAYLGASLVWSAAYYNNADLLYEPALRRPESSGLLPLEYDWRYGSPAPYEIQPDYWSTRWTGKFTFQAADYLFLANVDGGVRVYLDGYLLIDDWNMGQKQLQNTFRSVGPGEHTVVVEYCNGISPAKVQVWWQAS